VVEGVLLHLLRGAALPGLRGMPPRNGRTVRPLWAVWRRDVETYLRAAGVTPLRDPSNRDAEHYARVRVRLHLLPELRSRLPDVDRRVWRVAVRAVVWTEQLEREAEKCGSRLDDLAGAVPAVRHEVYRQLHGGLPALSRRHLEAVDRMVRQGATGDGLDLPAGRVWRERDHLVLERVTPTPAVPAELPAPRVHWCEGCEALIGEAVHLPGGGAPPRVRVRRRHPGLRLRPAGATGSRKLQDVLVDAGVPRRHRDALPLLFEAEAPGTEGRLLWVPGVARAEGLTLPTGHPGWHVSLAESPLIGRARNKKTGW
jgi:tRNA(Ile)-lysidine synthase